MKDLKQMFDALLTGETLYHTATPENILKIDDEELDISDFHRLIPCYWEIKQKPKWYDNIPESGVLCWCRDFEGYIKITKIATYHKDLKLFGGEGYCKWDNAIPLTPSEIRDYLQVAHDIESLDD